MNPTHDPDQYRHRRWRSALVLVVLVALVYHGVRDAGFLVDDYEYIEVNPTLESVEGLGAIWTDLESLPHHQYYPVTLTSFWLEHQLFGKDPRGYHLVNAALHALNVLLVWVLLTRLGVRGAWLCAALFAVHPVHVESVAWITERKNMLFVAFYLLAGLAYLRPALAAPVDSTAEGPRAPSALWYLLAFCLFVLAILSKTLACTLPAALVLVLWMKRVPLAWRRLLVLTPFFVTAIGLGALAAWIESGWVGASGEQWDHTPIERVLIAGRAVWFYGAKLVWPHPISFIYERWVIDSSQPWQYLFPISALLLPLSLWLARARIGRGPVVAVLFFGGTMAPTLGFFDFFFMRYAYVADHLQYLASIGFIALIVSAASAALRRWGDSAGRVQIALGTASVLALAMTSIRQVPVYESTTSLWRDTIAKNPDAWIAHLYLGAELHVAGEYDDAVREYERALRDLDGHPAARVRGRLGATLLAQGKTKEAIEALEATLKVKPSHAPSLFHLGVALESLGRVKPAIRRFRHLTLLDRAHLGAHEHLGRLLVDQGQYDEAVAVLGTLVEQAPDNSAARELLRRARARGR